ncbi:MAG: hypothetical protein ACRDOH_33040 [Streptosporangiaceae bacterium]
MSSLTGDCRAACSSWPAPRAESPQTSTHAASRSPTAPSVAAAPQLSWLSARTASVQAAGIIRLLPSGSTTSSSAPPCRRKEPSTFSTCPSSASRHRVTVT